LQRRSRVFYCRFFCEHPLYLHKAVIQFPVDPRQALWQSVSHRPMTLMQPPVVDPVIASLLFLACFSHRS
jgi:hypothetical protein